MSSKKRSTLLVMMTVLIVIVGCGQDVSSPPRTTTNIFNLNPRPNLKLLAEEQSSYNGSQAYNDLLFSTEGVNSNSGSLNISKKLISTPGVTKNINLSLNLVYATSNLNSGRQILHMPEGWSLQLSYIIPNKSVNIDGNNYLIDYKWSDESGYHSGLKYVNNHGINFTSVEKVKLRCIADSREYAYIYSSMDGGHQYFDITGKLIARDNNFGSCISYYYIDNGDMYSSYLNKVVDSYGQEFDFNYSINNYFTITNNRKQLVKIYYSDQGVTSYEDASGYRTYYSYTSDKSPLINKIKYPSGLTTQIQYGRLMISLCSKDSYGLLPTVTSIIHKGESGSTIDQTDYVYGRATGGHNFTGYGRYCLGGDRDSLIDSNDHTYLYDTTIIKYGDNHSLEQRSRVYYNFLHLPIIKDDLDSYGKVRNQVLYTYNINPSEHLRSASFGQPIKLENKSQGNTSLLVSNEYNEYNELIASSTKELSNGVLINYKSNKASYFKDAPYLIQKTIEHDDIAGTELITENTLNSSKNALASSSIYFNGSPWKTIVFNYDNIGRIINEQVSWLLGNVKGIKASKTSYNYEYSDSVLTTVTTNGLKNSTTTQSSTLFSELPTLKLISQLGKTIVHTYDDSGREVSVTDPAGNKSTIQYSVAQRDGNNSITKTNPLGYSEKVRYDELGRPLEVRDNGGSVGNLERSITTSTYTLNNQVASKTDKFGNHVTNYYDEFNRVIKSIDTLGNVTTMNYDDANLKTTIYLNGMKKSEEIKDAVGNSLSVTSYASDGQCATTVASYNGVKQKLQTTSFINGKPDTVTQYSYNGDGDTINTTTTIIRQGSSDTKIAVDSQYDLLGNSLTKKVTILGKGIIPGNTNIYNQLGSLISTINSLGQTKNMTYDTDGNLIKIKNYDGTTTSYIYDINGNITSKTTNGITTGITYDAVGHILTVTRLGKTISYAYTLNGLVKKVCYPDGKFITYTYNDKDLLTSKINVFGFKTTYNYDRGRISLISSSQGDINYTYKDNTPINSMYGTLTGYSLVVGGKVMLSHSYKYDGWNQIKQDSIRQNTHNITISIDRNLHQQISRQIINSDLSDSALNSVKEFNYDELNHLISSKSTYNESSGEVDQVVEQFSYDKNGNIITYDRNGVTSNYSYNEIDQLISVDGKEISYDAAGNMLTDPDGNQYSYNDLNQLVKVTNAQQTTDYNYYPDGMLQTKTTAKNSVEFYYDNGHADGIMSTQNGLTTEDSFLLSADGAPLASYRSNVASYYLKAGNSTIGLFDNQGDLSNSYKYDAYGSTSSSHPIDPAQSFLWNQEYNDPDTKLVYLRARFYNLKLMRFMNADTLNVANIYSFGNGNPINNIDPSGHLSQRECVQLTFGILQAITAIAMTVFSVSTAGAVAPVGAAATSIGSVITNTLLSAGIAGAEQLGWAGAQAAVLASLQLKIDKDYYMQAGISIASAMVLVFLGSIGGSIWNNIKTSSARRVSRLEEGDISSPSVTNSQQPSGGSIEEGVEEWFDAVTDEDDLEQYYFDAPAPPEEPVETPRDQIDGPFGNWMATNVSSVVGGIINRVEDPMISVVSGTLTGIGNTLTAGAETLNTAKSYLLAGLDLASVGTLLMTISFSAAGNFPYAFGSGTLAFVIMSSRGYGSVGRGLKNMYKLFKILPPKGKIIFGAIIAIPIGKTGFDIYGYFK